MSEQRFNYLLEQYITGKATKAERSAFFESLDDTNNIAILERTLQEDWESGRYEEPENQQIGELIERYVAGKIKQKAPVRSLAPRSLPSVGMTRRRWWWAAAAVLFVVCSLWFVVENRKSDSSVATLPRNDKDVEAPTSTKATITLANGKVIVPVVTDGKVEIVAETEYNILSNPRGSQVVSLTLSDGTKVWLNSESSIKYPVVFTGERKIELSGEGYFEVKKPGFKVVANGVVIEDLGTEFNVNSYEGTITTLVKGKVQILTSASPLTLQPGQQALNDKLTGKVDVQQVLAWKDGWFDFDQMDLGSIMRQVSRWYDVDIQYEGKPGEEKFGGRISKNLPLSAVMEMMTANGVQCRLEGKILKVKP